MNSDNTGLPKLLTIRLDRDGVCMDLNRDGKMERILNFEQEKTTPPYALLNDVGELVVGTPAKEIACMYPESWSANILGKRFILSDGLHNGEMTRDPVETVSALLYKMLQDMKEQVRDAPDICVTVIYPGDYGQQEMKVVEEAVAKACPDGTKMISDYEVAASSHSWEGTRAVLFAGREMVRLILIKEGKVIRSGQRTIGKTVEGNLADIMASRLQKIGDLRAGELDKDCLEKLTYDAKDVMKRLETSDRTRAIMSIRKKIIYEVFTEDLLKASRNYSVATIGMIDDCLSETGIEAGDVQKVHVCGSMSSNPALRVALRMVFSDSKLSIDRTFE